MMAIAIRITANVMPMAIPACAPIDSPLLCEDAVSVSLDYSVFSLSDCFMVFCGGWTVEVVDDTRDVEVNDFGTGVDFVGCSVAVP